MNTQAQSRPRWQRAFACCGLALLPCAFAGVWLAKKIGAEVESAQEEAKAAELLENARRLEPERRRRMSIALEPVREYLVHDRFLRIANQLLIVNVREPGWSSLSPEKQLELLEKTAEAWAKIVQPTGDDPHVWLRFTDSTGKVVVEWIPPPFRKKAWSEGWNRSEEEHQR